TFRWTRSKSLAEINLLGFFLSMQRTMNSEINMQHEGKLRIGFRDYPVYRITRGDLVRLPLDRRLTEISCQIEQRALVTCDMTMSEILVEEIASSKADVRHKITSTFQNVEGGLQLIADSLANSGILCAPEGSRLTLGFGGEKACVLFFPASLHQSIIEGGKLEAWGATKICVPRKWLLEKPNAAEIPNRWEEENANWPAEDYSRYADDDHARNALAAAFGVDKSIEAIHQTRQYGSSIGSAVGKEHSVGWLATDLKLEHFICGEGNPWHTLIMLTIFSCSGTFPRRRCPQLWSRFISR